MLLNFLVFKKARTINLLPKFWLKSRVEMLNSLPQSVEPLLLCFLCQLPDSNNVLRLQAIQG